MTIVLMAVWVIAATLLVLVLAMRPTRTRHSQFELKRQGDNAVIRRERLLGDITALRRVVTGLLFIGLVFAGLGAWQGAGVAVSLVVWIVAGLLSRQKIIHASAMRLYGRLEPMLLDTFERHRLFGRVIRAENHVAHDTKIESAEQLRHLVDSAGHLLSVDQQTIILRGLDWHTTPVESVMTPVKDIVSIKRGELLGPLVLDDLHRSGHDRFPVTKSGIDTVVGILDITQLLDATSGRRSETVEAVMSDRVLRIESDQPLPAALALLQKSHLHMLIVVDDAGGTAGLVTLADITRSLLGKTEVK